MFKTRLLFVVVSVGFFFFVPKFFKLGTAVLMLSFATEANLSATNEKGVIELMKFCPTSFQQKHYEMGEVEMTKEENRSPVLLMNVKFLVANADKRQVHIQLLMVMNQQ